MQALISLDNAIMFANNGPMKSNELDRYLRKAKAPALRPLARAVGISAPYLCDLRYGRRKPSAAVAERIERETIGAVKASAW